MPETSQRIEAFFNDLSVETMSLCDAFYHEDVRFDDPLGSIRGLSALKAYYTRLYRNVRTIRFAFDRHVVALPDAVACWTMHLQTPRLAGGRPLAVSGCSVFRFDPQLKVIEHRDIFDLGAFVYEHLPLAGWIVRLAKRRMAGHA